MTQKCLSTVDTSTLTPSRALSVALQGIASGLLLPGICTVLSHCKAALPSVLWRSWLGDRKGIQPVKNWVVDCWHGYLFVRFFILDWCRFAVQCLWLYYDNCCFNYPVKISGIYIIGWWHGVVVSGVRRMNEVNPCQARLVLWWLTIFGQVYHLGI